MIVFSFLKKEYKTLRLSSDYLTLSSFVVNPFVLPSSFVFDERQQHHLIRTFKRCSDYHYSFIVNAFRAMMTMI